MKKILLHFLFLILVFPELVYTQVTQEWVQRYNYGSDYGNSIAVDGSGNIYVTGQSNTDYVTIKYNTSGVQEWVQRYNGPANRTDKAYSIAVDDSGNSFVTGSSESIVGLDTNKDYTTIKYSTSGVQQWVARYIGGSGGYSPSIAKSIALDSSGNIYVTGLSYINAANQDYATIKYNSEGIQQWAVRYDHDSLNEEAVSIAISRTGNVYITGRSGTDYATIKYDSEGIQKWVQRYNGLGNGYDWGYSLAIDYFENVYVTGSSRGINSLGDFATIKYNSSGDQMWVARYAGPGGDVARSIKVDGAGNSYVTGSSSSYSGEIVDYLTIKYDSSGFQLWAARYNSNKINRFSTPSSMFIDSSGNVYVTGHGGYDYATVKYNSSGFLQWAEIYNGPTDGSDYALSVAVDRLDNVFITGRSRGVGLYDDIVTIKYSQHPLGIEPISNEIPIKFNLQQNYPNPFNPVTKIGFDIKKTSLTKLIIFDILGKVVSEVVNVQLNPGQYEVSWDAGDHESGIYFYKLETENFSQTKRMILLK